MPSKKNPLNLNPLQLRTLTLFQALASLPDHARPAGSKGGTEISNLPHAHGDHFHLGRWVVAGRDATGLSNIAAWNALERKGLIEGNFPHSCVVTPAGLDYDTGLRDEVLHGSDH
jgi:hypothetical protein